MNRPHTTLFLIQSLDGKITTGIGKERDVDKDFKCIDGVKQGLYQYYDLEKQTALVSINSGKVMKKIGVNEKKKAPQKISVAFVIIDNKPHLTKNGIDYLKAWTKKLIIVTTNKNHPAKKVKDVQVLKYKSKIDFKDLMKKLKKDFGYNKITIQSGGTLNAVCLRNGLIDEISIVIAPVLIGGENTRTLVGGKSLKTLNDLKKVRALKIKSVKKLKHSYLHLKYKVINK